jgi:acyl-CoA synthetase (AMP-forming)/AMP-acid ligase II
MLLHDILAFNKRRRGGMPALTTQQGRTLSFAALHDRSMQLANALARRGRVEDHVAILADNQPEYVEAYYGVPAARRRLVFLNYRLTAPELIRIINDSGATTLLYGENFADTVAAMAADLPSVEHRVALGPEYEALLADQPTQPPALGAQDTDIAWLIYTSGTTGMPKGAMISHRNLFASMFNGQVSLPGEPPPAPCFLFPFPLCHIAGYAVLGQHLAGNPVALMTAYSPEAWMEMVDEHNVTATALAPTMINMLLNHPAIDRYRLTSLASLGYGASSIPADVLRRAMDRFGPIFTQGFGMTELSGNVIFMSTIRCGKLQWYVIGE